MFASLLNGHQLLNRTIAPVAGNSLTHCILIESSTGICWTSSFVIFGVLGLFYRFYSIFDGKSC